MANIKLVDNYWETSGVYDLTQSKTQRVINNDVKTKIGTTTMGTTATTLTGAVKEVNDKANNLEGQITAYVEDGNTASRVYTVGQYLVWKGVLYKVTTSITNGGTISLDKLTRAYIGTEITTLQSTTNALTTRFNTTQVSDLAELASAVSSMPSGVVGIFSGKAAVGLSLTGTSLSVSVVAKYIASVNYAVYFAFEGDASNGLMACGTFTTTGTPDVSIRWKSTGPLYGSLPNNTDLNNVTTAGFYWLSSGYTYPNKPSAAVYGLLEVSRSSANSSLIVQKVYYSTRVNNTKTTYSPIFMRIYSGSYWYDWVRYSGNDGITCDTAIAIPASGSSVTKDLTGLTSAYQLVRWNFSSSPENRPPVTLTWTTYDGYFTITNNGGTTSETIKPMFVRAETKVISNHS